MQLKTPVACDCLNWCGDDPWLKDGRSMPCKQRAEYNRIEAVRAGIVAKRIKFNRAGDQLTIAYTAPLTLEQQGMVLDRAGKG